MKPLVLSLMVLVACSDEPAKKVDAEVLDEVETTETVETVDEVAEVEVPTPLTLDEPVPAGRVLVATATKQSQLVAGPKAEGEVGDFVFANARASFVVEGVRRAGGYRMWGGHLVDVSIDGLPDRFGEIWFAWNLEAFVPTAATIVSDGSDGVAHVRITGRTGPYPWPDSFLRPIINPPPADVAVTYDYRLRPDVARLELTVTLDNDGAESVDLAWPLVAMNMGDGVKSFAADAGFGAVAGSDLRWLGAVGAEASYALSSAGSLVGIFSYSNVDLLNLDVTYIEPGQGHVLEFAFLASSDGTGGIEALVDDPAAPESVAVSGTVAGPSEGAWVALTNGAVVGALALVKDGAFEARVAPGQWTATAYNVGVGASAAVALTAPAETVALTLPAPATLEVTIRDLASNDPIPAQLSLFPIGDTATPYAPANVRIDRDWGHQRSQVVFAVAPGTVASLPAGRYRAVASRGYSYEINEFEITLAPGDRHIVDVAIERVVDTTGWSAADFHLHATWSSDSDVPYDIRVRQAAVNDIALPVLTEHAYVGDLLSAAEIAGVSDYVSAIPAQEVTTFEYGHFNAFPLVYDADALSGGGVFEHGHPGAELFDAIRAQQPGKVMIQVNHPRSTTPFFAYFDYVELDAKTGVAAKPARFTTDWDLIEVFNGQCTDSEANQRTRQDWIDLTNLGWKKVLSSGSDSHSEASGVGHPRSWVQVEHTAIALDPQAIVAPLEARQTFVSCGPFVRFSTADGVGMGGRDGIDGDGFATFAVSVEAPSWMAIDTIVLLENGVPVATIELADPHAGPDEAAPAVRFDGSMQARPTKDAWYAIEVFGSGSLAPVEFGDRPYALTNGIEIDVDGDGDWTPPGPATPAP